jgi:hypothetical protein
MGRAAGPGFVSGPLSAADGRFLIEVYDPDAARAPAAGTSGSAALLEETVGEW